jgi:hypothetical protein
LLTNTAQVVGRVGIMAALIGHLGVLAVPAAFAVMAFIESAILAVALLTKIARRLRPTPGFELELTAPVA